MSQTTGKVLYIVRTWVPDDALEEWDRWHTEVHVPDVIAQPQVRRARKYRVVEDNAPVEWPAQYITVYEIDGPEVFDHPRYREVTGWGEWHQYVRGWTRTILRIEGSEETYEGGAGT